MCPITWGSQPGGTAETPLRATPGTTVHQAVVDKFLGLVVASLKDEPAGYPKTPPESPVNGLRAHREGMQHAPHRVALLAEQLPDCVAKAGVGG